MHRRGQFMKRLCKGFFGVLVAIGAITILSQLPSNTANAYRIEYELSPYATSRSDAIRHVDDMCNQGYPVGHGGYVHNVWLNDDTGVLTWSVTTLNRRCNSDDSSSTINYAVTGYDGICPVAGWYHNGSQDTHDCIKYQEPSTLNGVRKCGGSYPINNCLGNNGRGWWSTVYNSGGQPSTGLASRTYTDGFSAQIPNWETAKHSNGEFTFINNQTLCSYYWNQGQRYHTQGCQTIWAKVRWYAEWYVEGQSYIGRDGRVSGSNSNAVNRKQGENAIQGMRPGQQLWWDHELKNTGPDDMNETVSIGVNSVKLGGSGGSFSTSFTPALRPASGKVNETFFITHSSPYSVGANDAGSKVCQRINWRKKNWNDSSTGYSTYACAEVPYHYPSCDDPNDPDCNDWPYPSDPGGDCTYTGGCDDPNTDTKQAVTVDVSSGGQDTVMAGEDVTFTYNIRNDRGPTKTMGMGYKIYTFLYQGGHVVSLTKDQDRIYNLSYNAGCYGREVGDSNGTTHYVNINGSDRCQQDGGGSGVVISPGSHYSDERTYTILDNWLGQPGDQICSYIVLDRYWNVYDNQPSGTQLASKIACVKIGKRPQIQLNGSDSYANEGFTATQFSNIDLNHLRGSYSQYGLLTNSGRVSNFGSAGYTFADPSFKNNACALAWANSGTATGNCNSNSLTPGRLTHTFYSALTNPDKESYPGSLASVPEGTHYYTTSGNLTLGGTSLGSNRRVTIYVGGDVTINGNINIYGGTNEQDNTTSYTNPAAIPSLTIIADGDISINGSVERVDANLVTENGRLITCQGSEDSGTQTELGIGSTQCSNKLKINGAVASKESPVLHRIFGAGNTIGVNQWDNNMNSTTSEWFNYTPNTWLTPYLGGTSGINGYTTVQVTNLPVRY